MSTQLILFPQNYLGYTSTFTANTQPEMIVDGINFTSINTSTTFEDGAIAGIYLSTSAFAYQDAQAGGIAANTWYRIRSTLGATSSFPAEISNDLFIYCDLGSFGSGVYQRLSNLITGQLYTIDVDMTAVSPTAGKTLNMYHYNGGTLQLEAFQTATDPSTSAQFDIVPATTNDIVVFFLDNSGALVNTSVHINSISCTGQPSTPSGIYRELQDGQVICDLYQEEDIPLTLSIDDFKNVAEKVQSYSKDFNLPATKRNNQIFNNMFDVTRADDGLIFNPYVRTKCVLKQDGFILFEGFLRMIDIKDKEGEISYNVNLYSEVIALADTLKDRTFSDLDFTELEHTYNKNSIKNSWYEPASGTGLPLINTLPTSSFAYETSNQPTYGANQTNVLKYPFVDWSHQILLSNGTNGTSGNPELTTLQQAFRPFINIKYLINKIFADAGFNWTSDFFDSTDFGKLYMDFNWGADNTPISVDVTNFTSAWAWSLIFFGDEHNYANTTFSVLILREWGYWGTPVSTVPPNYDISTNIITSTVDNETYDVVYSYTIENVDTVDRTVECQWLYNSTPIDNSGVITIPASGTWTYSGSFLKLLYTTGDTLKAEFKSDDATGTKIRQYELGTQAVGLNGCIDACNTATVKWGVSVTSVVLPSLLKSLRGELGQWDFLKGIMTMFNLITMVDESNPNNILIEPYADIFINNTNCDLTTGGVTLACRSIEHDWTEKIDVSQMELRPLTDLNKKTIFKFVEDDDDYTFNIYKNSANHLYGSKKYDASAFTILEGEDEIIAEPFAATVPKPLFDQFGDFITPAIFTSNDEATEFEGFDNAPRIMYNNGRKILNGGVTYFIPAQNGLSNEEHNAFLQFSHLTDIPTITSTPPVDTDTRDFHFGECQYYNPIGATVPDNLFNLYWLPYYNELYNADTRIMTLKVNLSPADVASFKFYDTVFIKNRSFRVNKIEYKPNSLAKVEFILIP